MNYRHAFHAGNFADCMKHALLLSVLRLMQRKPAALFVLDTHAGRGAYDLMAEAERTGEWRDGIARLIPPPPPLSDYVALVQRLGLYPGSPNILRACLRPGDVLACCELHPDDHAALRRLFRNDPLVSVHRRDGYEAVGALLPPAQRRGLVLIDPPYEADGEFARVLSALQTAARRFAPGVYAAWYPIKHRSPVNAFHRAMQQSGLRDIVALELWRRPPTDPARLNGCGLLLRNPPFGLEETATPILTALQQAFGEHGAGSALLRIADE